MPASYINIRPILVNQSRIGVNDRTYPARMESFADI